MKTCPSCHQALADDALFCPIDGTPLASVESDPLLGSIIADRYVLLERVGQGNSGTIYRAEHVVLRQSIAVKLLHLQLSQDQAAVERFREEVTTLALLKSNSIVRGSDFGVTEDGRIFFAMEYLEGETLAATLGREGRFTEDRARALLEQIGEALAEAHKLGFVHRDIRPRNIFLIAGEEQEQIKLLDFGLAKLAEPHKGAKPADTSIGDPRYMSPEQARGDVADFRGDIYSLAIIAYELVTGNPPFVGAGTLDVLTKHLEAQPVPIKNKASEISQHFADSVAYALRKRAKDRYSTVTRFLDALAGRAPVEDPTSGSSIMRKHRLTPSGQLPRVALASKAAAPVAKDAPQPSDQEPAATLIGTGLQAAEVIAAAKKQDQQKPKPAKAEPPATKPAAAAKKSTAPVKDGKSAPAQSASGPAAKSPGGKKSPRGKKPTGAKEAADTVVSAAPMSSTASKEAADTVVSAVPMTSTKSGAASGDDFEAQVTHKIELQPPIEESKAADAVDSGVEDRASGSVDTSTPLAVAPSSAPLVAAPSSPPSEEAPASAVSSVVIASDRPQGADISSPEFSLSEVAPAEEASYQEEQLSQSTNWFAEGLAAEKQLATTTKSGPLPSIYSTMNEEEEEGLSNRFSPALVIGIVVGVAAIFLLGFIFMFTGSDEEAVAASKPPAAKQKETVPEVKSAFAAAETAKAAPVGEAASKANAEEASAGQGIKPQAVALPDKEVETAPDIKAIAPKTAKVEPPPPKKVQDRPKAAPKTAPRAASKTAPRAAPKAAPKPKPRSKPRPAPVKAVAKKRPVAKPGKGAAQAKAEVRAGQNSLKRGAYTRAKQSFTKALQLNPRSSAAHAGLGELAFEQGKYASAAGHLRRALKYSPRNSRIIVMLGNAYFKQKKTKDAVVQYRKALKINPNNAAARAGLEASIRRLAGT